MNKSEDIMHDVEAQNGSEREFSHIRELERIRSSGMVTISPELFEKVTSFTSLLTRAAVHSTKESCGGGFPSKICKSDAARLHGVNLSSDLISFQIRHLYSNLRYGSDGMGWCHHAYCRRVSPALI
jgi:hypothetical protein